MLRSYWCRTKLLWVCFWRHYNSTSSSRSTCNQSPTEWEATYAPQASTSLSNLCTIQIRWDVPNVGMPEHTHNTEYRLHSHSSNVNGAQSGAYSRYPIRNSWKGRITGQPENTIYSGVFGCDSPKPITECVYLWRLLCQTDWRTAACSKHLEIVAHAEPRISFGSLSLEWPFVIASVYDMDVCVCVCVVVLYEYVPYAFVC